MKLDSTIYSEAQKAARTPQFKYLILGLVCGTIVPTVYARHYFLPHYPRDVSEQQMKEFPADKSISDVSKDDRSGTMRNIDEENTYMLISSIL